ncbi:MAG: hypothetical protein HYU66_11775 [Armatimonadetes bacterium]|nr:hypothetical protein [Armatimonadota bacterium]
MLRVIVCGVICAGAAAAAEPVGGVTDRRLTLADGARRILSGAGYRAVDAAGTVFDTGAATLAADGQLTFALTGPAAADAQVAATFRRLPHGFALDWQVRYTGAERTWNGWGTGFQYTYAEAPTGARTQPLVRWVKPGGAQPWEVPGDTPYPDSAGQLREVDFGELALVMIAPYDPDWLYGGDVNRTRFGRAPLPKGTPAELRQTVAYLLLPKAEVDPARLAAEAAGQPLALSLGTDRVGNLFAPGEPVAFTATVANLSPEPREARLALEAWSYRGERLLSTTVSAQLGPGREHRAVLHPVVQEQGVVFVGATLSWPGGETEQRMTLGVLPARQAGAARPDSPFGLAGLIAAPERYADQYHLDTVLGVAERVGARWVRGGWYPLKTAPTPQDDAQVAARTEALRRHGILPFEHSGTLAEAGKEAEQRAEFDASFRHWSAVTPYVEVGNELNLGGLSGKDYVEKLLKPASAALRQANPAAKVLSMGLGGVSREWLASFTEAGGFDLIDVLSVHPGCHPKSPEFWEGWRGWVFRSQVQDALKAAREHGGKDVWITEAYAPTPPGRSGLDLRTAADYLVRTYVCAWAAGVKKTFWYQLQDGVWFARRPDPQDIEYSFGIVYTDLSPKPAYVAYGTMTEQLEGATCVGRLDLGADDLYGVRFRRGKETVDVLWSCREKHETDIPWWPPEKYKDCSRRPAEPWVERWRAAVTVELPAAGAVSVTDLMGNARPVAALGGRAALALTGSPIYVRGLGEAKLRPQFWEDLP